MNEPVSYIANTTGLSEIREFLKARHKNPLLTTDALAAWASEAEGRTTAGEQPRIEIPARDSVSGVPETYEITLLGLDALLGDDRLSVDRADYECDQPGVAYAKVWFRDTEYTVQISRPRHPSNIGRLLSEGAAIHTDEGHDDNAALAKEIGDEWWEVAVAHIIGASGAEAALEASTS